MSKKRKGDALERNYLDRGVLWSVGLCNDNEYVSDAIFTDLFSM